MRQIRRFLRLSEASVALCLAQVLVQFSGFHRFRKMTQLGPPTKAIEHVHDAGADLPLGVQATVNSVNYMSERWLGGACLARALATQWMLARRGFTTRIQIGAPEAMGAVTDFHAWVEWDGRIILGEPAQPHTPVCTVEIGQSIQRCLAFKQ